MIFDESYFSVPKACTHLGAQALQCTGYIPEVYSDSTKPVLIKLLSTDATNPSISTSDSVGIDLCSVSIDSITIPSYSGTRSNNIYIVMEPAEGTYVRIV